MTVEGNVNSGLPKGSQDRDGVHMRDRWIYDVIGFGRPNFKARPSSKSTNETVAIEIKLSNVRPGRKGRDIATVQLALTQFTDLRGFTAGAFDSATKDAYARWQRMVGYVASSATGIPDLHSLERLGRDSGLFTIIAS
jgi:peptidoglycan hydrolase-like protein with peptidoglycan-binding domain